MWPRDYAWVMPIILLVLVFVFANVLVQMAWVCSDWVLEVIT